MIVGETTGLEDDGAQLGDAAATGVVEVNKRKAGPGHRILQERNRRRPRQAMLAAQMQKSADKAVAAVSVIITAARPVAVFGKILEHQIEQLYRLRDLGFRHWSSAPMLATNAPYHAADRFRLTFRQQPSAQLRRYS